MNTKTGKARKRHDRGEKKQTPHLVKTDAYRFAGGAYLPRLGWPGGEILRTVRAVRVLLRGDEHVVLCGYELLRRRKTTSECVSGWFGLVRFGWDVNYEQLD